MFGKDEFKIDLQLFTEQDDLVDDEVVEDVEDTQEVDVEETEDVKPNLLDLLEEDEDIKKQFQSEVDRMISKAIATRDKKHKEELKKQEQRANMTAEELQAEKERELQEREQKIKDYELRLKKVEFFKENNVPLDLIDFVNVDDEDEIEEKTEVLMGVIDAKVEEKLKAQLKHNGISVDSEDTDPVVTVDDLSGMSTDEINKLWDKVK